ncbi:MAG: hypothetical protein KGL39_52310, partial [Patescibacteria group bacterium]|nr:hypothetical protein [Patescibacteria group bacterium]
MATGFKDTPKEYYALQQFKGIDTKSGRTVIAQDEFSWLENAIPIGNGNLRAVGGPTQVSGLTWSSTPETVFIANIMNVTYLVAFEQNGGAEYYNFSTGLQGTLATASTFSSTGVQATMWENTKFLIVDPSKGYFEWDGTNLVNIGSIGLVTVTSGGSGYYEAPTVTFSGPNQTGGIPASGTATAGTGASSVGTVTGILVTNPGSGYTSVPQVTISAPPTGGTLAQAVATLSGGTVVYVQVTNPGSGYTSVPSVTFTGGGTTSGATATASLSSGPVTAITMTEPGTGYTSAPTITFSGGGGSGAAATAAL